jgi:hypothetical protein
MTLLGTSTGLGPILDPNPLPPTIFDPPPSSIPSGFDAIVEISLPLLQQSFAANLAPLNLSILSARVPYQPEIVSPGLQALIAPILRTTNPGVVSAQPYIEVQVLNPVPEALNWPAPPAPPVGVAHAVVVAQRKMVTLVWTIEVNLFWPSTTVNPLPFDVSARSGIGGSAGGTPGSTAIPAVGVVNPPPGGGNLGNILPPPLPAGSRRVLVQGTATMNVPSALVVNASLYQFQLVLNFEGIQPTYTSTDPVMLQFLDTPLAASLFGQAVAFLLNQYAIGISPTVALAGNLTPSQIGQMQLPALSVDDIVLQDASGQLVAFCVSLGSDAQGVLAMVTSFLGGQDFAYYASEKLFAPVLRGLWQANAILTPLVSDVGVEMPVSQNSNQTGLGRARVQVYLSNTLDSATLIASTNPSLGDPMQIASQQTVTLLALWDPEGNPVSDLGDLGKPATEPFALSLQMYDQATGDTHPIQPQLSALLAKMFMPLFSPVLEQYSFSIVSGFTSSPLQAIVSRWSFLRIPIYHVHQLPSNGTQ